MEGLLPFAGPDTYYFQGINRNKRSVALDLQSESGRETLNRIVRTADVVVHNYLPAQAEKLGLTYEQLVDPEAEASSGSLPVPKYGSKSKSKAERRDWS